MFLTKNPRRYIELADKNILPRESNMWYGSTATTPETEFFFCTDRNTFISIEPIHAPFSDIGDQHCFVKWVIVGAETGNQKRKIIPEKGWIDEISRKCREDGVPIFMKESLRDLMGSDFRQELPWEA